MINIDVFRNFIKEFVFFSFVKEHVVTLIGSDFSQSVLRGKKYGHSQ